MSSHKHHNNLGIQWVTTALSTTLVLVLLGTVALSVLFARNLSDAVKEDLMVSVLLKPGATDDHISQLQTALNDAPYICHYQYVSSQKALQEQVKAMGSDPSEFLGTNPFTASFELHLDAEYANTDSLQHIARMLKDYNMVDDVVYHKDLVEAINTNITHVSYILLALAALLTLLTLALTASTMRLSVYSSRMIIRTMQMVGATNSFIRRPFLLRAAILALSSALLADAILMGGVSALLRYDPTLQRYTDTDTLVAVTLAVPLVALLLTTACTWLSVTRCLRLKERYLY